MSTPTALRLDGELTIYRAQELRQTLLDALDQPGDLRWIWRASASSTAAPCSCCWRRGRTRWPQASALPSPWPASPVREVLGLMGLAGLLHPPRRLERCNDPGHGSGPADLSGREP
jgi:hypothetical protein